MSFPEDIFPNNPEVLNAFNLAEFTSRPLYITGKAGTGKSTFLRYYCENTHKKFLILAPTGLAALNVGGQTLHSFFGLPWRPLLPNDREIAYFPPAKHDEKGNLEIEEHFKRKIIRNLDVVIIDEISMVRPDIIDAIDNSLRKNGGKPDLPFGGKQVVFIGDLFQLEPVVKKEDLPIISRFYDSPFFFSARIFQQIQFSNIEFVKVYRQSDSNFIGLLDKIRNASANSNDFVHLNSRYNPEYQPVKNQYFVILCTTNAIADGINAEHLKTLETAEFIYTGTVEKQFGDNLPALLNLKLKVGAQVMFVRNDAGGRWVNGTIGKVTDLTEDIVKVKIKHKDIEVEYAVEVTEWEKIEYKWNNKTEEIETEVVGTFTQYPLKLAWAITIHKSQGLTFDQVIINSGNGMFAHGQCYVALSRCTSFEGLILSTVLKPGDMIVDKRVIKIANTANNQHTINEHLFSGLFDRVKALTKQFSAMRFENKRLQNQMDEKNRRLSELQSANQSYTARLENLQNELQSAKQDLEKARRRTNHFKEKNRNQNSAPNEPKDKFNQKTNEVQQQKKAKWYEKLVGVK